jgi:hypothetical protein
MLARGEMVMTGDLLESGGWLMLLTGPKEMGDLFLGLFYLVLL